MNNELETAILGIDSTMKGGDIKDVEVFLSGMEISSNDYEQVYNSIGRKINSLEIKLKKFSSVINKYKQEISDDTYNNINSFASKFKAIKDKFKGGYILTPAQYKEKLLENSPIELGLLSIRSSWHDIPLNPEELSKLKPEKLLARTDNGVEYYQVTLDGITTILRYNSTDSGDEVALYELDGIDLKSLKNDEIKKIIIDAEGQKAFKDVEMEGTASARNGLAMTTGLLSGGGIGVGGAIASSIFAGTGVLTGGISVAGGVVIGGIVASMTDLDYTSEDYAKYFGADMQNAKRRVASYLRK